MHKIYWAMVAEKPPRDAGHADALAEAQPGAEQVLRRGRRRGAGRGRRGSPTACSSAWSATTSWRSSWTRAGTTRSGRSLHAIGCHIKGDLKYGAARSNPGGGIHLHARQVSFVHPVKKQPLVITADPPPDPLWDAALARWSEL